MRETDGRTDRPKLPAMTTAARRFFVGALVVSTLGLHPPRPLSAAPTHQPRLAGFYDLWLRRVRDVASDREVEAFLDLARDVDRERFIRRFWEVRGRDLLLRFRRNELAVDQLRVRSRDEERVLRLLGKPERMVRLPGCGGRLRDLTLWVYPSWSLELQRSDGPSDGARPRPVWAGPPLILLFVPTAAFDPRTLRLWSQEQGFEPLARNEGLGDHTADGGVVENAPERVESAQAVLSLAAAERCVEGDDPRSQLLRRALDGSLGFPELVSRFGWTPPDWPESDGRSAGSSSSRAELVPALRPGLARASRLDPAVELSIEFPAAYARETVAKPILAIDAEKLRRQAEGVILDRLTVLGDLYRGTRLQDSFAFTFHVVGPVPPSGRVSLEVPRRWRPGRYRLRLRLAAEDDLALLREDVEVEIPEVEGAPPLPGTQSGLPELTRQEVVRLVTFPRLELLDPGDRLLGTTVTVEAVGTGGPFSAVEFRRDGELVRRDERPPFSAEVEMVGERHRVSAVAFDAEGRPLAADQIEIERRADAFAVDLRVDDESRAQGLAVATVEVPEGERLERFECWADRTLARSLREPPWECPLPAAGGRVSWVRGVAVLESGASVEDLVFLSGAPDTVDVQLVELYVSVLDGRGRPVPGLGAADFTVRERGAPQLVESVRGVDNLPLDVAVLMDTSSSLGRHVRRAAQSAQRFFEDILRPQDRASLISFNHDVRQLAPFTASADRLRYAAIGLRAGGSTRLYDSLFYSLYTFAGLAEESSRVDQPRAETGSRRALVVLSDGADVDSDLEFDQVLEEAVRSRVSVYPIALGAVDEETRSALARLADETGGRLHSAAGVSELDRVFERIANELRSQYLLVYRPVEVSFGARDWSAVDVEVERADAAVRGVRGLRP